MTALSKLQQMSASIYTWTRALLLIRLPSSIHQRIMPNRSRSQARCMSARADMHRPADCYSGERCRSRNLTWATSFGQLAVLCLPGPMCLNLIKLKKLSRQIILLAGQLYSYNPPRSSSATTSSHQPPATRCSTSSTPCTTTRPSATASSTQTPSTNWPTASSPA